MLEIYFVLIIFIISFSEISYLWGFGVCLKKSFVTSLTKLAWAFMIRGGLGEDPRIAERNSLDLEKMSPTLEKILRHVQTYPIIFRSCCDHKFIGSRDLGPRVQNSQS